MKKKIDPALILGVDWSTLKDSSGFTFYINFSNSLENHYRVRYLKRSYREFEDNFKLTPKVDNLLRSFLEDFKSLTKDEILIRKDIIQKELISFFTDIIND